MSVNLPLTGAGGTTATIATEQVGGAEFQYVKLADGQAGSTLAAAVEATTPSSDEAGLVVRTLGTTAYPQGVTQTPGTTGNFQYQSPVPFSSGNVSRTSVSTTVDTQLIAANANRKALIVANRSTAQTVGIGFSTAAVTTALANVDLFLGPSASITFGGNGTLPPYRGPLRGINLTSTTVAGSVALTEFQ